MANLAAYNPPREVLALGRPNRVYQSVTSAALVRWTLFLLGWLAILSGIALLVVKTYTKLIHIKWESWANIGSGISIGIGLLFLMRLFWINRRRPKHLYALYPQGLVMLHKQQWAFIAWNRVAIFELDAKEPYLYLENRAQIPISHDFGNGAKLYQDIAKYVYANDSIEGDVQPEQLGNSSISKTYLAQLLIGMGMILGAAGAGYYSWEWLYYNLMPPSTISHEQLNTLGDVNKLKRTWVSIASPAVVRTNIEMVNNKSDISAPESKIVLIPIKDRYLIANVRPDFEGKTLVQGELEVWKNDAGKEGEKKKEALEQVLAEFPQYKEQFMPFQFDASFVTDRHAPFIAYGLVAATVFGVVLLIRGIWLTRRRAPQLMM